jgi:hypothetical protein
MFEWLGNFYLQVMTAEPVVWTMAMIMSLIAGHLLNEYIHDLWLATVAALTLFCAILIGDRVFLNLGLFFTTGRDSNAVASAGAAICIVAIGVVVVIRIWHAIGAYKNRLRGDG